MGTPLDEADRDAPDDGGKKAVRVVGRTGARFGSRAMRRSWQEEQAEQADPPAAKPAEEPVEEAPPPLERRVVGRTGARFGSRAMRRGWQEDEDGPLVEDPLETVEESPRHAERLEVGRTGARFGSPALRRGWQEDLRDETDESAESEAWSDWPTEPLPVITAEVEYDEGPESPHSRVRPYALTGGRTAASYDLQLETLLSFDTSEVASPGMLARLDHRSIVESCYVPTSVAEVAATQSIPLGVAKILISDLIELGVLIPHQVAVDPGSGPSRALLERVLEGLHRL